LLGILVVSLASLAWAGIPDLNNSSATIDGAAAGASVFNLPNGQGYGFDEAAVPSTGDVVNATITLELLDGVGDPIETYPFEDMWLVTSGGGLVACADGTSADNSTDEFGMTEWVNPMFAGGHSEGETVTIMVAGSPLNQPGLNVIFNSADINGDLVVNLADLTPFSTDFFGAYNYRSDFVADNDINLGDVTLMARGYLTSCP
jgi:hypothetical protein